MLRLERYGPHYYVARSVGDISTGETEPGEVGEEGNQRGERVENEVE